MFQMLGITALSGLGGTGLGGGLACLWGGDSRRMSSVLLSYAAGIMIAVVCFDLLPESVKDAGTLTAVTGVLSGCFVVGLLHWQLSQQSGTGTQSLRTAGWITAIAIALHNLPEGMAIGASFANGTGSGWLMAAVIGLHNIPEGMAVAAPLIFSGSTRGQAVRTAALAGLPTVLGAVLGYRLIHPLTLSLSLSLASGAMLYVAFGELLPESIELWASAAPTMATILGLLTGLLILGL